MTLNLNVDKMTMAANPGSEELVRTVCLLRATLESTAEGIAVTDLENRVVLSNRQLKENLRLPDAVFDQRDLSEHQNAVRSVVVDPEEFLNRSQNLLSDPEKECCDVVELRDGRFLERHTFPLFLRERIVGRVWNFRDITRARCAEAERAASLTREQELRAAAEASEKRAKFIADASILLESSLDYEGTIRTAAKIAVPRLSDWCAIDMLEDERHFRRMAIAHQDHLHEERRRNSERLHTAEDGPPRGSYKVMKTGEHELLEIVTSEDFYRVSPNQDLHDLFYELGLKSYMCLPLKARGRVLGAITLVRICGSLCYTAADLAQAKELAHRAALAIDNSRLYREAQEAIQTRHEVISVASHEMRTPLTALLGYLQLSRRTSELSEITSMLASAEQQCLRLVRFMNSLLDVSRIDARGLKLELERLELGELVHEIHDKIGHAFDLDGVTIQIRSDGPIWGSWDRLRLEQVLTNLMTNAIKYGAGKPIEIRLAKNKVCASLIFTDHGIGISEENLARIFQRFERAVSNRSYKGAGLGLWITRSIVEAHGGQISVGSKLGQGSQFRVELPLSPPGSVEPQQNPEFFHPAVPGYVSAAAAPPPEPAKTGV